MRPGIGVLLLCFFSCFSLSEEPTKIAVTEDTPTRFVLEGSGKLSWFRVRSPHKQREAAGEDASLYWVIKAKPGEAKFLKELSPLEYGYVPSGYEQVYPERGAAPKLVDGDRYFIRVLTTNAPGADGYLTVKGSKAYFEPYPQ